MKMLRSVLLLNPTEAVLGTWASAGLPVENKSQVIAIKAVRACLMATIPLPGDTAVFFRHRNNAMPASTCAQFGFFSEPVSYRSQNDLASQFSDIGNESFNKHPARTRK